MVEVVVKKVVRPEELDAMCGREVLAKVDGALLTAGRARVLYEFYQFAGFDMVQRWKFCDYGPFAKAYAKWLSKHLAWLARQGLLEEGEGPMGGKAYRITKDGIKVLCELGLL